LVVDSSALLAVLFDEPDAGRVVEQMNAYAGALKMSTVNLAEVLIHVRDRRPARYAEIEARIMSGGVVFVPPDAEQARTAAEALLRFPINLGDCFAYALAVAEDCPILSLDPDFKKTDRPVLMPERL
jgi:ribonuclease VapC